MKQFQDFLFTLLATCDASTKTLIANLYPLGSGALGGISSFIFLRGPK